MTLTLRLRDVAFLDNGMPTELVLHRRGALIGRSPTCEWSLPDALNHVSSRHCEIRFEGEAYVLVDLSTNGTFLNGAAERLPHPHALVDGDRFALGSYEVEARLTGGGLPLARPGAATGAGEAPGAAGGQSPAWGGWEAHGGAPPPAPPPPPPTGWDALAEDGWGAPPTAAPTPAVPPRRDDGWGAALGGDDGWGSGPAEPHGGGGWAPGRPTEAPAPVASPWAQAEVARPAPSAWSSAAPDRAPPPTPDDIWGRIAAGHVVDWARGGSGGGDALAGNAALGVGGAARTDASAAAHSRDVGEWANPALPVAPPSNDGWGPAPSPAGEGVPGWPATPPEVAPAPAASTGRTGPLPAAPPPSPPPAVSPGAAGAGLDAFLAGAGLPAAALKAGAVETLGRAGELLRQLVAGMVVMVEARARAKAQMGAEATSFSFDGNNPFKFARTPEQALEQLLNPKERGFLDAPAAVQDAFNDLQSHQMATLQAMQGALRATLDRFSPAAIRSRAEDRGLLARILPGAREAALWQAYEREYGGVKLGSDEAFMDVFAREFRRAYEEQSRSR